VDSLGIANLLANAGRAKPLLSRVGKTFDLGVLFEFDALSAKVVES
jgi:hypothetical protein